MLVSLYLIVWWKYRMNFFLKIKQDKLLDGHITYRSHMSISKDKTSTYACLWPIEFCQIIVTLGRIFSCFHDRDHIHSHIHANSFIGSYAKHAIHPPKISTPSFNEISLLVILWKERGVIEKIYAQEAYKKERKKPWPPSKTKARRESQRKEYLEKQTKIFHTLAYLDQVAWLVSSWIRSLAQEHYVAQVSFMLILPKALHTSHRVGSWGLFKILWWGNKHHLSDRGNHPRNFVSLCKNFQKHQDRGQKKRRVSNAKSKPFYSSTSKGKVKSYKPHR
jgi:hypothetical protein